MDDAFGYWFAGFTDGEGTFIVYYPGGYPRCMFAIALRADDAKVIRMIRDTLGFGSAFVHNPPKSLGPDAKMQVRYSVNRTADCLKIVDIFTRYPLRAKKAAQFAIWREAVLEMGKGRDGRSREVIDACRARLRAVKTYILPEDLEALVATNPPPEEHYRAYGDAPLCLCGCGDRTSLISHANAIAHPENPNYCAYTRGHNSRVSHWSRQRVPAKPRS